MRTPAGGGDGDGGVGGAVVVVVVVVVLRSHYPSLRNRYNRFLSCRRRNAPVAAVSGFSVVAVVHLGNHFSGTAVGTPVGRMARLARIVDLEAGPGSFGFGVEGTRSRVSKKAAECYMAGVVGLVVVGVGGCMRIEVVGVVGLADHQRYQNNILPLPSRSSGV